MKKTIITTATAFALMAVPMLHGAKADTVQNTPQNSDVKYYQFNNMQDLQSFINQFSSKYHISLNNPAAGNEQAKAPVQSAPKQQTATANKDASKTSSASNQTSSQLNAAEKKVVALVNEERAKNGLPALKIDPQLSKMARTKSEDMQKNHYFDHTSPTYGSPFDMMKKFGITYSSAGENIAMGQTSPEQVMNAWMNSPGHRANILNKSYTSIGVGYDATGNYWTQEFIGK
ncbi:CAP domain-containing protein [Heyndrickxia acidicola]|uniref:CAP domain-containing protein n=1 Tax=Heyndrickxia acidicola TaxID=209389 RepID=A0ABU6MM68_9BACI|nr:CAP domain-containing protein [Heyndrickxia acidicola]MED1205394.1 CAP domain-containing protein [Heyndrickxia acidicola]